MKKNTALTLPNLISIFRILLIGAYLYYFYANVPNGRRIAGFIVLFAGFSDWLDGYIARKYKQTSVVGQALDPLADKLMSLTVLLTLVHIQVIPIWFFLGILSKELLLIVGGVWSYFHGIHELIPSNQYGKIATLFFYIAVLCWMVQAPAIYLQITFGIVLVLNWVALFVYLKRAMPLIKQE